MMCPKIVFLCHFSSGEIRTKLKLKSFKLRNILARIRNHETETYKDFAIWVSDYIEEFEKHPEFEIHIVAPHRGLKKKQTFKKGGLYYHFYKMDGSYLYDFFNEKFNLQERLDYSKVRKREIKIIQAINPNLIVLCGAENPHYSRVVTDLKGIPIYVILQTLLNDPKRIEMGVGTAYRRNVEIEIFKKARYFCTSDVKAQDFISKCNKNAVFLPAGFPTHRPLVIIPEHKDYDFVFFSRNVTLSKGIEDLLKALSILKKKYESVSLNIIGSVKDDYKKQLFSLISELKIEENIHFAGFYDDIDETYNNVVRSKVVAVPGITAGLNSTVREAMFMGMPTVCYETSATVFINEDKTCLLTAPMSDVKALADQMFFALEKKEIVNEIVKNAKEYAEKVFGNEAIVNNLLSFCKQIIDRNA